MTISMTKVQGREDQPTVLMAHVKGLNAADIAQAAIDSMLFQVWQYDTEEACEEDDDGTEVGEATALTVADCVFDTLKTDYGWDADDEGYNVRFTLPKARLPTGNKWYRVELWITPATGEQFLGGLWGILARAVAKS